VLYQTIVNVELILFSVDCIAQSVAINHGIKSGKLFDLVSGHRHKVSFAVIEYTRRR